MAYFIALDVPQNVKEQFSSLDRKGVEGEWAEPDDLHITLRYLGDAGEEHLGKIQDILTRVRVKAFHIEVSGLGYFQDKGRGILWGKINSTKKVTHLVAEINEKLLEAQQDMPLRPFVPHITFARLHKAKGLETYIHKNKHKIKHTWQASSFHLMKSGTVSGSERYSLIQSYQLPF